MLFRKLNKVKKNNNKWSDKGKKGVTFLQYTTAKESYSKRFTCIYIYFLYIIEKCQKLLRSYYSTINFEIEFNRAVRQCDNLI